MIIKEDYRTQQLRSQCFQLRLIKKEVDRQHLLIGMQFINIDLMEGLMIGLK
jgi:hypothetical protein